MVTCYTLHFGNVNILIVGCCVPNDRKLINFSANSFRIFNIPTIHIKVKNLYSIEL